MTHRIVVMKRAMLCTVALMALNVANVSAQSAVPPEALHAPGLRPFTGEKSRQKTICGTPSDTLSDVTRLWESARLILDGSRKNTATSTITFFDRRVARDGKVLESGTDRTREVSAARPFSSLPPDSVANAGYVIETPSDVSYYAPDADVLLSTAFAESHCFGVQSPPSSRPGAIGLSFRPKGERDGVHDISGTFWFDRATLAMQQLEFRYTNVPPAYLAARVGGELTFARAASGAWSINSWEIRMPQGNVESQLLMSDAGTRARRQVTIQSLRVAGGKAM